MFPTQSVHISKQDADDLFDDYMQILAETFSFGDETEVNIHHFMDLTVSLSLFLFTLLLIL